MAAESAFLNTYNAYLRWALEWADALADPAGADPVLLQEGVKLGLALASSAARLGLSTDLQSLADVSRKNAPAEIHAALKRLIYEYRLIDKYRKHSGTLRSGERSDAAAFETLKAENETLSVKVAKLETRPVAPTQPTETKYTVAQLCEMTKSSNATINRYAKAAGIPTPGIGKRNHEFTKEQAIRIMSDMSKRSDKATRQECKDALDDLSRNRN